MFDGVGLGLGQPAHGEKAAEVAACGAHDAKGRRTEEQKTTVKIDLKLNILVVRDSVETVFGT